MNCRFCKTLLKNVFIDLSNSPPSNSYLTLKQLNEPELFYPLRVHICHECKLVQVDGHKKENDIFNKDYLYFSSYSTSWLSHAKQYAMMITDRLSLNESSLVTEIASNDGYLLQYFNESNICLGIEPASSTAKIAKEKGIKVIEDFFSSSLAKGLNKSDLIIGNNVIAHVPDIDDFVKGLKIALKEYGSITIEFPHILNIINKNQFDTIYHEHFSYLSFYTVQKIFKTHNLELYDVEKLSTHGGSIRIYAKHISNKKLKISKNIEDLLNEEREFGLLDMDVYKSFQKKADKVKYDFIEFLIRAKKGNKKVIAYGAAAKGNTLLNYAGIKSDLVKFVADKSPYKQGKYLPASHIPIVNESNIKDFKPDYILIFPWNIKDEIMEQLSYVKKWGCEFVIAIPSLEVLS